MNAEGVELALRGTVIQVNGRASLDAMRCDASGDPEKRMAPNEAAILVIGRRSYQR